MLLDVFYVQYSAQTGDAEKKIDDFGKKAEKVAKDAGVKIEDTTKKLGDTGKKAGEAMDDVAKKTDKLAGGLDKVRGMSEKIDQAFGKIKNVKKLAGDIGEIGTLIKQGGVWGAMASMNKLTSAFAGGGGAGGGEGGLGLLRAAAGAGGPIGMVVAGVIAAGAFAVNKAIAAGHEHAEAAKGYYGNIRKESWEAGMSEKSLLGHQIAGEQLGISRESTQRGLAGLNEKIKEVALHRAQVGGGVDMKTGQDTNPLSRLLRRRGIGIQKGGHLKNMDQIWQVIVDDLRDAAKKKGTNYALARATQQYGLDFDQASKVIEATSAQIKDSTANLEQYRLQEWAVAQSTKELTTAQTKLKAETDRTEKAIDAKVVPAMVQLTNSTANWERASRPFNALIGKIEAALIRAAAVKLDALSEFVGWMEKIIDVAGSVVSAGQEIQEAPGRVLDSVANDFKNGDYSRMISNGWNALKGDTGRKVNDVRASIYKNYGDKDPSKWGSHQREVMAADANYRRQDFEHIGKKYEGQLTKAQISEAISDGMKQNLDNDTMEAKLAEMVDGQKKGMEANDAQFQVEKEKLSQIAANTSVGLEQAIALWAGGVGRQGGLGGNAAGNEGQSRADYEKRYRSVMYSGDRARMSMASHAAEKAEQMSGAAKVKNNEAQIIQPNMRVDHLQVEVATNDPQTLGEQIGKHTEAMMSSMYKHVAQVKDSVFKA